DRLRHDAEAVVAFEGFLAARPDAPQHAEVIARLEILRRSAEAGPAAPAVDANEATEASDASTVEPREAAPAPVESAGPGAAPWIVLGVGGAVAIVGAILLGVGYADIAAIDAARDVPFSSVSGAYDTAPVLTGTGWAALGVGV